MPTPMGVGGPPNTSYAYPYGYPQQQISPDVIRSSLQSAVLDKVRYRFDEAMQMGNAEIDSLRKAEQDLTNGEKKLQLLITSLQQQQTEAQLEARCKLYKQLQSL